MICPYCGKENVDRAPFCADCGKSLAGVYDNAPKDAPKVDEVAAVSVDNGVSIAAHDDATKESVQETVVEAVAVEPVNATAEPAAKPEGAPASSAQPAATTTQPAADPAAATAPASATTTTTQAATTETTAQAAAPTAQPGVQYQQVPQPQQAPCVTQAKPVYAKGCVGAAWSDITSTTGWFKKILLLGLIMCVPILNFYVIGYCMRWGRQLVLGKIESMPEKIFEEGNFSQGFYGFVWLFVLGLVCGIASSIISWIPLLGALAAICIYLFQELFGMVGMMRVAISKQLGKGFDISEDWRALTKNFGSLFCASILPQLVMVGVIFIGAIILTFAIIAMIGTASLQYAPYYYSSAYDVSSALAMISMMLAMIPAFLVFYVIICIVSALVSVWTYRAVGHYVARELPEWKAIAPQFEQ